MKTLMKPDEVARIASSIETTLSPSVLSTLLPVYEEKIFNTALGIKWYEELLDDLIDGSEAEPWRPEESYLAGDLVHYYGSLYAAIRDTTEAPDIADWEPASRFKTAHNQEVYDRYLSRLIAFYCAAPTASLAAIRVSGSGSTRSTGESFEPASFEEIASYHQSIGKIVRDILFNLHLYLTRNASIFVSYRGNVDQAKLPSALNKNYGFTNIE